MNIYKITDLKTGKIYIGQELNYNKNYFGSGLIITRIIKKRIKNYVENILYEIFNKSKFKEYIKNYGFLFFSKEILEENFIDKEDLNLAEIFWILNYQSQNKEIGYNIAPGGFGGDTISNNPNRDKICKNMRHPKSNTENMGSPKSEKTKKQIGKTRKDKKIGKGKNNPMHGTSAYKIWIKKYGIEEANIRQKKANKKNKEANSGENSARWKISNYDIWLNKFGKEIADQKLLKFKNKIKNRIPWNKGLTKESDERVKNYGKNRSENALKNFIP